MMQSPVSTTELPVRENFISKRIYSGFDTARGHKMERENYLEALRKMTANPQSSSEKVCSTSETIRHGNLRTISTQTNNGVWLDVKKSKNKRKRQSTDSVEDVKNIKGTILVDGSNLISDGCGHYYMRVDLNDIRPLRSNSNSNSHSSYRNYASHSSNIEPIPSASYYANHSNHSNYRPNPSGTFFPNHSRYSNDRHDRRNADRNTRTFSQAFPPPKFYHDADDLFP